MLNTFKLIVNFQVHDQELTQIERKKEKLLHSILNYILLPRLYLCPINHLMSHLRNIMYAVG